MCCEGIANKIFFVHKKKERSQGGWQIFGLSNRKNGLLYALQSSLCNSFGHLGILLESPPFYISDLSVLI